MKWLIVSHEQEKLTGKARDTFYCQKVSSKHSQKRSLWTLWAFYFILFYFILFFTFSPNWACIYLFFKLLLFFLLWWILSCIEMKQPCVYMCSPSWSPLPPLSPPAPSRSSQCTRSERLSHAYNLGWWSVSRSTVYHSQDMEAT